MLGIIAFDTLHVLRYSRPLPRERVHQLALFLDFEGCANAACDRKYLCAAEYQGIQRRLETAGLRFCAEEYLGRLGDLESRRPAVGGDRRRFDEVRSYREEVARLSLGTAAAIALNDASLARASSAPANDADVDALFHVLMQCQIIDDVLDYKDDAGAGLPSFLTATASLAEAMELTASASQSYAADRAGSPGAFPLRLALGVVSAMTRIIIRLGRRRLLAQLASTAATADGPGTVAGCRRDRQRAGSHAAKKPIGACWCGRPDNHFDLSHHGGGMG